MKYIVLYVDFKGMAIGLFTKNKHNKEIHIQDYKLINPVSLVDIKEVTETWEDENKIHAIVTNDNFFKEELNNTMLIDLTGTSSEFTKFQSNINDGIFVFKSKIKQEINKELQIFEENTNVVNHVVYMLILGMKFDGFGYEWMFDL